MGAMGYPVVVAYCCISNDLAYAEIFYLLESAAKKPESKNKFCKASGVEI
jgi:hypothetical protein